MAPRSSSVWYAVHATLKITPIILPRPSKNCDNMSYIQRVKRTSPYIADVTSPSFSCIPAIIKKFRERICLHAYH